jgi:quercetin dioxygenase-like cupin family protein
VIEEHDELGSGSGGHEELYFVATGHAEFTLDGATVDAPAGSIVFVRPEQRRGAIAKASGTTVLAARTPCAI